MALTGYNEEEVRTSISGVKRAYEALITAIADRMQSEIVNGMSDKWACTNAQQFFNEAFKPAVDGLISGANTTFESVVNAMNEAAKVWAAETGESYSPVAFSIMSKNIDASGILENIGGVRGIDLEQASSVAAKLPGIASDAETAVTDAANAVANCGFVGGDQASQLINSLNMIKSSITEATTTITDQTKQAFENTIASYGDTAGQISQAFAGN